MSPKSRVSDHVRRRTTCRLCSSDRVDRAFALTATPPANAFVAREALGQTQDRFPLDLFFCHACTHLQLLDVVDPRILFENYVYVSGTSPSFVRHFQEYASTVAGLVGLAPGGLVIDIGSNDGTLLRPFRALGARTLGIDPARAIAAEATRAGIETIADFFSPALAAMIAFKHGPASIVTANNVFAHIDDLGGIADGVHRLLAADGVFVFEVSYLLDVIDKTLFDTIYHEHLAYHAVRPLMPFLARHGLELIEALRVPTHGGSLRGIAQRAGGPRKPGASIAALLAAEEKRALHDIGTYRRFAERIDVLGAELTTLLRRLKSEGSSIAGFGAPAKATTLMYHFGLGPEVIDFIVDDSPLKQNLFTPGLHVPVVSPDAILQKRPDYLLVLAWNFAEAIIARNDAFRAIGGHFIIPVPTIEVI
jgi:SAM-dependent methyltransferase